jgi:glycosidase
MAARAAPARITGSRINRDARDRFDLTGLVRPDGRSRLSDIPTARAIAHRLNQRRDPARSVQAGELAALGLIDELQAALIRAYEKQVDPKAFAAALEAVEGTLGEPAVDSTLEASVETFPPDDVRRGEREAADLVDADAEREAALRDLVITWLDNVNPAVGVLRDLVDDRPVAEAAPPYPTVVDRMDDHFAAAPRFGEDGGSLLELLRAPALAAPTSLAGQLRYIKARWADLLGDEAGDLLDRLQIGLDVIAEEERALHLRFGGGGGGGDGTGALVGVGFEDEVGRDLEPERFSQDLEWMPRLVLIAKSTYVWLDQLSRQYERDVHTLDAIPDEELDRLARLGISGLWLIGLWERSEASREIKRRRGDAEAEASAYSLEDYQIAADIGGPDGYANLRDRAWSRGIRLASDMVPNHMGLDSRWVVEHPDWFLSLPFAPYPAYSFNGPDLSHDDRVSIVLEDHYWDGTDAAVVFKRYDRGSGEDRYIYHGNDGTSFPWNDTAQLDFLNPAVREGVIQTILHVARQFPVIRFDAAMVLAKKHIQRLWHPLPGQGGGAIPSRAEHSMPKREFDRRMPIEFWREVVDRVAAEAPGTLLLAEAFWLMEGYFVRTLGMHRVYNSAFMNLLRDERNADYRKVMRETLEFDPEILKRFVNFMNNPDEKTAVEQFGTGDKYFGIATLMATMPGLPMYGHGQFEGFTEKYGMEFRRARWQEEINQGLYEHHQRAIVPLLHRRSWFAEVRDFLLYDVVGDDGGSRDDMFAYSNLGPNGERSLVVYHNRFGDASGWIRDSVSYSVKTGDGNERSLIRRTLGEGLRLDGEGGVYWIARDWRSGLEHLWPAGVLRDRGLFVDLHAYECRVFLDWRQIRDDVDGSLWRLSERLGGAGVPSVEAARTDLLLEPIREPFWRLLDPGVVAGLASAVGPPGKSRRGASETARAADAPRRIASAVAGLDGTVRAMAEAVNAFASRSGRAMAVDDFADSFESGLRLALGLANDGSIGRDRATIGLVLAWLATRHLGGDGRDDARRSRELFDEWRLGAVLANLFRGLGLGDEAVGRAVDAARALVEAPAWPSGRQSASMIATSIARGWLDSPTVRQAVRVHEWDGVEWFDGDAWSDLVDRSVLVETVRIAESGDATAAAVRKRSAIAKELRRLGPASGYRLERLLAATTTRSSSSTRRPTRPRKKN